MMIFDMPTISSWARGRKVRARRVLTRGCRVRRSRGSSTLGVAMPMKRWIWWRCIAVTMSRVPSTSGRPVAFLLMSGPRVLMTACPRRTASSTAAGSVMAPTTMWTRSVGHLHRRLGVRGAGDVQLDDQQVFLGAAQGPLDGLGASAGGDDRVAGGKRGLGDVHAHATAGAGNKPDLLVGIGHSSAPCLFVGRQASRPAKAGAPLERNSKRLVRIGVDLPYPRPIIRLRDRGVLSSHRGRRPRAAPHRIGSTRTSENSVIANFAEIVIGEVRRIAEGATI